MNVTAAERVLLAVTLLTILYRLAVDQWPVGLEVEPTEGDA